MTGPVPGPLLSVLICTLARREASFLRLLAVLLPQAEAVPAGVEVAALRNGGERPLADYRQALTNDASGRYLCFVDDDDMVAPDYVSEICRALAGPLTDIVGFEQECTGLEADITYLSTAHAGMPLTPVRHGGRLAYLRSISHMMPVRAELARQASWHGWDQPNTQEDTMYARSMAPLLEGAKEAYIPRPLYRYQWNQDDSTQHTEHQPRFDPGPLPVIASPCFRWHPWSV